MPLLSHQSAFGSVLFVAECPCLTDMSKLRTWRKEENENTTQALTQGSIRLE